jgi:hypothetical protein
MIRAKLWFRCAVVHDPVTPTVVQPAVIGWEAKQRQVLDDKELVIEMEETETFNNLQQALDDVFGNEVDIELIKPSYRQ